MRLPQGGQFSGPRAYLDAAGTSIEADSFIGAIFDAIVVDIVNHCHIQVVDGAVVIEVAAIPVAALIPDTHVAEAIIHSTVEANVWSPIASIKLVAIMPVAPVAGRPKRAFIGSLHPDSGYPVVAAWGVAPVAGGP